MYRKKPMAQRSKKAWRTVGIVAACIATLLLVRWGVSGSSALTGTADGFSSANGKTLIIHIFADTDPEYLENLKFFVQWGIPPQDQSDYVVVVRYGLTLCKPLYTHDEVMGQVLPPRGLGMCHRRCPPGGEPPCCHTSTCSCPANPHPHTATSGSQGCSLPAEQVTTVTPASRGQPKLF